MRRLRAVSALAAVFCLACLGPGNYRGGASSNANVSKQLDRIETKVDAISETQTLAQESLDELLALARQQGTGEITLFFSWNGDKLRGEQHDRFVRYLDRVAFEARGREVLFVALGSAGDWKKEEWNKELSDLRSAAPRAVAKRHLVHVPHRWVHAYGVSSALAPAEHKGQTWRHVRVIAVYDEGALPELPPVPYAGPSAASGNPG